MSETSEKYKTSYHLNKKNDDDTIVFIHGVGLTKEIWKQQLDFFKNYNTLTYDLLGHGKTPLEKTQLNFEDYTKQLLNLIDELNINKIHLVETADLDRKEIEFFLNEAKKFINFNKKRIKKNNLLEGRTIFNLFFEDSTRTRTSF